MQLDIRIDTPLLPGSVQEMLKRWRKSDTAAPWFQELETVYQRFSAESWEKLAYLVLGLRDEVREGFAFDRVDSTGHACEKRANRGRKTSPRPLREAVNQQGLQLLPPTQLRKQTSQLPQILHHNIDLTTLGLPLDRALILLKILRLARDVDRPHTNSLCSLKVVDVRCYHRHFGRLQTEERASAVVHERIGFVGAEEVAGEDEVVGEGGVSGLSMRSR